MPIYPEITHSESRRAILINILFVYFVLRNIYFKRNPIDYRAQSLYQIDISGSNVSQNDLCPDIEALSLKGEKYNLRDLTGNIIVIRFTRFSPQDLPNIIYLDHVFGKYAKYGLKLFFIKIPINLQNSNLDSLFLSAPVLSDDGYILASLNASIADTIIIGKDFRIKCRFSLIDNKIIFKQIMRFLFNEGEIPQDEILSVRDFYNITTTVRLKYG